MCFLINFTELELTNVQAHYWWGQIHFGPKQFFLWGGHGPRGPRCSTPMIHDVPINFPALRAL